MKKRIISFALIIALAFNVASCENKDMQIPDKEQVLTVENESVSYNDAEIDELALEFADLCMSIAPIFGYPIADQDKESKKQGFASDFKTDYVPILFSVPIYKSEVSELFACAEKCIQAYGEQDADDSLRLISDLYIEFNSILETERLGYLMYELQGLVINKRLEKARENFDKYGDKFSWYADDLAYYEQLVSDAQKINRNSFSAVTSVFMFLLSASLGTAGQYNGAIGVKHGDIAVIMQKQSERFKSYNLTSEEWSIATDIFEEFISVDKATSVERKVLKALKEDNFFTEAAVLMPDIIDFYADIASDISEENIAIASGDSEFATDIAVCKELLKNKDRLMTLLDKFEETIPAPGTACINIINQYYQKKYEAFCNAYSATSGELISAMEQFVNAPDEESRKALSDTLTAYVASINPVIAYAYFYA